MWFLMGEQYGFNGVRHAPRHHQKEQADHGGDLRIQERHQVCEPQLHIRQEFSRVHQQGQE